MTENTQIKDYTKYNERMEMSVLDKLFFLDKITPSRIIDFGCANGALLKAIHNINPNLALVGYDIDPEMEKYSNPDHPIFSNWDTMKHFTAFDTNVAINLSSVIHEVFHYGSKTDIQTFWSQIFNSGFKYIIIRDMVPSRAMDRVSNINDIRKIYYKFLGSRLLDDFERIWGSIENNRNLIHFLLKYRYEYPNWEREVRENYLPITRESLLAKIPLEYDIIFHEHYTLPYILQTVKNDVGIEIKDPTHIKLILERK